MDIDIDFSRNVWCLLGLPFDAIDIDQAATEILSAIKGKRPCFLSTPNLNFLCAAQADPQFKLSVINSDLSVADGFPIVLVAKLLKIPIPERVAGSNLIEHLHKRETTDPIKVFFFGGAPGIGELACKAINQQPSGMKAVGHFAPGFGSVDEMSAPAMIANINKQNADFVIVALGAKKGQAWAEKNRGKVKAYVISHLGAVINFFAGTVKRAPVIAQRLGLEWLWRIYQEPSLWRRYYNDGLIFMKLLFCNVIPYWFWLTFKQPKIAEQSLTIDQSQTNDKLTRISLIGNCTQLTVSDLRPLFKKIAEGKQDTILDLALVNKIDSAFLGLCLVLYKHLSVSGCTLKLINLNKDVNRILHWQKVNDLLV
jgi:N-acetylglucosaminyldiphosphoundecaprenol N-acetyl-beta-D-mannosaminyltransferase